MKFLALLLIVVLLYMQSYAQNTYRGIVLDFITLEPVPNYVYSFFPVTHQSETIYEVAAGTTEPNGTYEFINHADTLIFKARMYGAIHSYILRPFTYDTLLMDHEAYKSNIRSAIVCYRNNPLPSYDSMQAMQFRNIAIQEALSQKKSKCKKQSEEIRN